MRRFIKLVALCLEEVMYYKISFILTLFTPLIVLGGQFLLWHALFNMSETGFIGVYNRSQMYTYIIIAFAIGNLLTWSSENNLSREIRSGTVASRFIRPVPFWIQSLAGMTGFMIPQSIVNFSIVGIVYIIFHNFLLLPSIEVFILFILSLIGAMTLRMMMINCISLVCFFTTSHLGLTWTRTAIMEFFSGALIPVALFPLWLANFSYLTPFPLMLQIPITIFLGEPTPFPLPMIFALQIGWSFVFFVLHQLLYRQVRKNVTFAGG
jgi:ABC-2 type transport system permease protein